MTFQGRILISKKIFQIYSTLLRTVGQLVGDDRFCLMVNYLLLFCHTIHAGIEVKCSTVIPTRQLLEPFRMV